MSSELTRGLLEWLRGATTGALLHFHAATTPSPSHRPRVTRRGFTYLDKKYAAYLTDCQSQFAQQRSTTLTGRLSAVFEVIIERPRTSKLTDPNADTDNLIKGASDALEKAGVVANDKQIIHIGATRRFATPGETPGVNVWVGEALCHTDL